MSGFKKSILSICLLSTVTAYAGTMGAVCSGINSTIPCPSSGWAFGGKATYLQASTAGVPLLGDSTQNIGTTLYSAPSTPYGWGGEIEGAYYFDSGNDINVNWYYTQYTASQYLRSVWTFNDTNWNAVNVEFGQRVNFGDHKYIRFHGGGTYGRILNDWRKQATGINAQTSSSAFQTNNLLASYNGVGPRLGADMNYLFKQYGVGVYANGAAALLIGQQRFTNVMTLEGFADTVDAGTTTVLVPELEAKLGINYTRAIAKGQLTVDAGWMWINYFNAFMYDQTVHSVIGNQDRSNHSFALQGPFFGLKWAGNFA